MGFLTPVSSGDGALLGEDDLILPEQLPESAKSAWKKPVLVPEQFQNQSIVKAGVLSLADTIADGLEINLSNDDDINETFIFKDVPALDYEVEVGVDSIANFVTYFNTWSSGWKVVRLSSGIGSPSTLIFYQNPGQLRLGDADRLWLSGTGSDGANMQIIDFAGGDYKANVQVPYSDFIQAPTEDPETSNFGFSYAVSEAREGELRSCILYPGCVFSFNSAGWNETFPRTFLDNAVNLAPVKCLASAVTVGGVATFYLTKDGTGDTDGIFDSIDYVFAVARTNTATATAIPTCSVKAITNNKVVTVNVFNLLGFVGDGVVVNLIAYGYLP